MTFEEREYQTLARVAIFKEWETRRSTMVEMATGTGKTFLFANVIKQRSPGRALVLAHRNELVVQAKHTIESVTGLVVEVEKAELYASTSLFHKTPVVVSSIQTQCSGPKDSRRYMRFKPEDFSTLICDEFHHAAAPSWKEVIEYYMRNPNLKMLGVTATGDRADGKGLGGIVESVAFKYGILDAIKDGCLVDIAQQFVSVKNLDFSHIKTTMGDLNEAELAKVMEIEENVQGICQPTLEAIFGLAPKSLSSVPVPEWSTYLKSLNRTPRRTIVFTVSVLQAEMCCNIFLRAMNGVRWVCGKTRDEDRATILKQFRSGEISVVVNCGVLTEGYDNPWVELVSVARPTKSRSLYCQMIGRATRTLPGVIDEIPVAEFRRLAISQSAKPFCRILDFVGNSGRHKLISCIDVLGGHVSEEAAEEAKKIAIKDGTPKRIMVTMTNAEAELRRKKEEALERARIEREARKRHLNAKVTFNIEDVNPFGAHDTRIPMKYGKSRDGRDFSEPQLKILRQAGCEPNKIGYKQGQAIIAKQIAKWKKERGQG